MEYSFNKNFELLLLFFFILINISCRPDEVEEEPLRDYLAVMMMTKDWSNI